MKKFSPYIKLLLLGLFIFLVYIGFIRQPSFDRVLTQTAAAMNKTCPHMADKDMRLDKAIALPNNVFQYHYTLVNLLRDSMDVELFIASIEPAMIRNVARNPDLSLFRENRVTLSYHFTDMAGNFVTRIVVSPKKYIEQ
jgi:hypothetical protein